MGGLVARAWVEGDAYVPESVGKLILIAPPNHGSRWASLRLILEAEEHYHLWRHEPDWSPAQSESWCFLSRKGGDMTRRAA